jgi:hypothetical protein
VDSVCNWVLGAGNTVLGVISFYSPFEEPVPTWQEGQGDVEIQNSIFKIDPLTP